MDPDDFTARFIGEVLMKMSHRIDNGQVHFYRDPDKPGNATRQLVEVVRLFVESERKRATIVSGG